MTQPPEDTRRAWDYATERREPTSPVADVTIVFDVEAEASLAREANVAWAGLLRSQMPHQIVSDKTRAHLASAVRHLDELELTTNPLPQDAQRHIVQLRLSLMEEVFEILRLDRYANVPANEGWMNRFRSWANSPVFGDYFPALSAFSTQSFVHFVNNSLMQQGRAESQKAAHPWDAGATNASFLSTGTVREHNAQARPP